MCFVFFDTVPEIYASRNHNARRKEKKNKRENRKTVLDERAEGRGQGSDVMTPTRAQVNDVLIFHRAMASPGVALTDEFVRGVKTVWQRFLEVPEGTTLEELMLEGV